MTQTSQMSIILDSAGLIVDVDGEDVSELVSGLQVTKREDHPPELIMMLKQPRSLSVEGTVLAKLQQDRGVTARDLIDFLDGEEFEQQALQRMAPGISTGEAFIGVLRDVLASLENV